MNTFGKNITFINILIIFLLSIVIYSVIYSIIYSVIYIVLDNSISNEKNKEKDKEMFLVQLNPDNDGQMSFNYLVDPNYSSSRLSRYYINDDVKINGNRLMYHPYQNKHYNWFNNQGFYGDFYYDVNTNDKIYKNNGIRL
jgi:hypothetical protein